MREWQADGSYGAEAFHIALEVFPSRIDIASVLPKLSLHILSLRPGRRTMVHRHLLFVAAGILLAGCAANARPSDAELAAHGYWYHDANHMDGPSGQASPQAIYNTTHGIWLWPPANTDIPN